MVLSCAKQHLIKIYIVVAPGGELTPMGAVHLMWVTHNFPPGQAGFMGGVNKIGHPSKNSRPMAGRQKPLAYQESTFLICVVHCLEIVINFLDTFTLLALIQSVDNMYGSFIFVYVT